MSAILIILWLPIKPLVLVARVSCPDALTVSINQSANPASPTIL